MKKFSLGSVVITIGISGEATPEFNVFIRKSLDRHRAGDWGDVSKDDKESNDYSLDHQGRLLSSYTIPEEMDISEGKIWIITEWDRSVTTILFPSEY